MFDKGIAYVVAVALAVVLIVEVVFVGLISYNGDDLPDPLITITTATLTGLLGLIARSPAVAVDV